MKNIKNYTPSFKISLIIDLTLFLYTLAVSTVCLVAIFKNIFTTLSNYFFISFSLIMSLRLLINIMAQSFTMLEDISVSHKDFNLHLGTKDSDSSNS